MLATVAFGQTRLTLPGLLPDTRGVVVGRELCARFPTLDRLVWFFRLLSGARAPDELWLGLRIVHARSALGLRELVAMMPNPSSNAADLVARAARSAGGQCFTGSGRHYVQYRDARAPFGYDATEISHLPGDLTLYAADSTAAYRADGELPFDRILYGLEPRRQPGPVEARVPAGESALTFVTARRGLGPRLIEHLLRAGVRAEAALCEPDRPSSFGLPSSFWLLRIEALPPRLVSLLARTPGFVPYTPVLDNVLVAAGFSHPIHLEACRPLFAADRMVLFGPPPNGVIVLRAPPPLVPISDLVPLHVPPLIEASPPTAQPSSPPPFEVPLRLEPAASSGRAVASWIPWWQAAWFRRLCYALPPAALRGHRVALLEPALLVLAAADLAGMPFGQLLDEVAPGILVPLGMRLAPAVSPERLAERLAISQGTYLVFPGPGEDPLRVSPGQIEPLERHILAQARIEQVRPPSARRAFFPVEDSAPPDVTHDPLGPWPLWGLRK